KIQSPPLTRGGYFYRCTAWPIIDAIISDMDIKQLQQQLVQFRNERDWQQFHNPKDLSLSLTLEAAEVLEHFQWKNGDEIEDHIQANKDDIGEELADVLWYLMLLADGMNIDLGHVLEQK